MTSSALPVAPVSVTDACTACGACLLTCPEAALRPVLGARPPLVVLAERCTDCLGCLEVCPAGAIIRTTADAGAQS